MTSVCKGGLHRLQRSFADYSLPLKLIVASSLILIFWRWVELTFCHMDVHLYKYLITVDAVLKAANVTPIIFYGPLIGFVRSGRLLDWDYDVDICIDESDKTKLLSLRDKFKRLGFVTYGQNEFIWHKFGGDMFQISDPILRMYIPGMPPSHIEFFMFHDETGRSAKKKGYRLPYNVNDDMILSCSGDWTCWQKDKIFPLKKSTDNEFGIEFYYPNDPEYVLKVDYGEDWRIPYMKGWKPMVCYAKWEDESIATARVLIVLWYLVLTLAYLHGRYHNVVNVDAVQHHIRGSELESLFDVEDKTL